jgi:hypothetical protein
MDTARAQQQEHVGTRSAALVGRVVVPANGKLGRTRIRIHSSARTFELECDGGTWERFGLPPGAYRIELVADRIVLAKRVELAPGDEVIVDFEVR